ncbi:hypothetical protein EPUL_003421 [Erysiphe pulchra]|uniref:Uncharacterized protein n=1 Tax=Erysiphe pulchra TaxID=225359 RepID=A0A2S4PS13_9PEZI|nr:hypothetical protein EPUL_003421 [Erysiphe pulchra]
MVSFRLSWYLEHFQGYLKCDPPAPSISIRAAAIKKAMLKVSKLCAKRQVTDVLRTRNDPITNDIPIGSDVLVWRVHENSWNGPYKILTVNGETGTVQMPYGPVNFRLVNIKQYNHPIDTEPENKHVFALKNPDVPRRRQPTRNAGLLVRYRDDIYIKERFSPNFTDSRRKKLNGLLERGVFSYINLNNIPTGARIFNSRFIDQVKHAGTANAFEKSRLAVQACDDDDKKRVLTQSPVIQRANGPTVTGTPVGTGVATTSTSTSTSVPAPKTSATTLTSQQPTSTSEPQNIPTTSSKPIPEPTSTSALQITTKTPNPITRTTTFEPSTTIELITSIVTVSGSVVTSISSSTEVTTVPSEPTDGLSSPNNTTGIDSKTRNTIIGVISGIGALALLGGVIFVIRTVLTRRRNKDPNRGWSDFGTGAPVNDNITGIGNTRPINPFQSTLENYHNPARVNASSNF